MKQTVSRSETTKPRKQKPGRKKRTTEEECIRPSHQFPIGAQMLFKFYAEAAYAAAHGKSEETAIGYLIDMFAALTDAVLRGVSEQLRDKEKKKPGPKKGFKRRKKRKVLQ